MLKFGSIIHWCFIGHGRLLAQSVFHIARWFIMYEVHRSQKYVKCETGLLLDARKLSRVSGTSVASLRLNEGNEGSL